jgi:RNA polymerase sigma-70 factor (ECF subfamily)
VTQQPSDEVLAARAKDGDTAAFEELFHRYKKAMLNFIYRMVGNRETAEEVAQDAFIKAFRNLYLYDPGRKFSTWLYTIARNLAKNALRDRRYFRDRSLEETVFEGDKAVALKDMIEDPNADPSAVAESNELEEEAQKVLDTLPVEYKEIITLCSIQGLTYEEAAAIIGLSPSGAAARLEKAKELFMKRLGIDYREK